MATTPQFTTLPRTAIVKVTTANTNRDGSGGLSTLAVGGANGTRISRIVFQATGTTTAGTLRLFVAGMLYAEIATAGATPSGTVAAESHTLTYIEPALVLAPNVALCVCNNNSSETWNIFAECGDF